MKQPTTIKLEKEVGKFCADGRIARSLLNSKVTPALNNNLIIVFDCSGVRNMNSSFSNALFGNLIKHHGKQALKNLTITNTRANVKQMILSGLAYGESANTQTPNCIVESTPFSDFVRNASTETKEKVFGRVINKTIEQQKSVLNRQ